MVRNLITCGAGLVFTAVLGLVGQATPTGLTTVTDADARQILGAGDKVDCKKYKETDDGGCGGVAKPETNGVGQTKCVKGPALVADDNGDTNGMPFITVTCYECCYTCGTAVIDLKMCGSKSKSGHAQ